MDNETQALLLAMNIAGWRTWYLGAPRSVVFVARNRHTGEERLSRAPVAYADQAARYLAERCGVDVNP